MSPPIIRPRDKRSTAAGRQFLAEAAQDLVASEQQRVEAMRWLTESSADPLKGLDALVAYRRGQIAVDTALARYYAALRLAGVTAHAIGRAVGARTATVAARVDAVPEARLIRYARGADIKVQGGRYFIQPRQPRNTVIEEL